MKPWREVCEPHPDVLKGTFQQSEFAADITAVKNLKASRDYQDAAAFYERTFITEGMRLLLTQVARRWNGQGGEPVIQLQTGFGGGKTHTMLAVYHLARRTCPLQDLAGIPSLLDQAGLLDVPRAGVAVLDGNAHSPGQPWKHGALEIRTLWGELAYQLGNEEAYSMLRDSDLAGTSPGKELLRTLLERYAPCVVLIDELVAYVRQFADAERLPGGTYDSNISFVQALTEATKAVPTAILLATLPESELEAGSSRGKGTLQKLTRVLTETELTQARTSLKALEKNLGRVQAIWKPVATEEAFEIVRRRLFKPIADTAARDEVCRAFAKAYVAEGDKVPSETHEARYTDRLMQAYPIHPEVFDRLFEDWSTLEGFQRTRGVLKLMARVIYALWQGPSRDSMILPGDLPLDDADSRNELVAYLPPGWDAVIERDIDGKRAETTEIESKEPRFGAVKAALRVARAVFLGTAPSSGGTHKGIRGVDKARVILGCLQPGQSSSTYGDALGRLADRLHYLNSSGDKSQETTLYWFDTRTNIRREMEERKSRFEDRGEVRAKIQGALKKLTAAQDLFEYQPHIFTLDDDVPDDAALRLVILPPEKAYSKQDPRPAQEAVLHMVRPNGGKVRHRGNRLVFVAADEAALPRLRDAARTALSWKSIIDDIDKDRLNIDQLQDKQARAQLELAENAVPAAARACFKWVLCPVTASSTDRDVAVEVFQLNPSNGTYVGELARVCSDNELVVSKWSPVHLRDKLRELYWGKNGEVAVRAATVWEDIQRYFYMPRLKRRHVLEQTITAGAAARDFFGTAYGKEGDRFEGFKLGGGNPQFDDTLLLIEPAAAEAYETAQKKAAERIDAPVSDQEHGTGPGNAPLPDPALGPSLRDTGHRPVAQTGFDFSASAAARMKSFHGAVDVNAATAKVKLVTLAEEIIALLASDPNATVRVTVEIEATFPQGASDATKRAVSENATALGFKSKVWE